MPASYREAATLFRSFGAELRPQYLSDWRGPVPLPAAVARLYSELGPVNVSVPGYGNDFFLPTLADLWRFQAGYRFNGDTGEDFADWPADLLVVTSEGADPIAVSRTTGGILTALHGRGSWEFVTILDSLCDFIVGIAALGSVIEQVGYSDLTDDDGEVHAAHVLLAQRVLSSLNGASFAPALLRWAGWTSG